MIKSEIIQLYGQKSLSKIEKFIEDSEEEMFFDDDGNLDISENTINSVLKR